MNDLEIIEIEPDLINRIQEVAPEISKRMEKMATYCLQQQREMDRLRGLVEGLKDGLNMPIRIESPEQDKLRVALGKASLDCAPLVKTGSAQGGRSAYSLEDVQVASKDALRKNQVAINFEERKNLEDKHVLITIVTHIESGEYKVYTTDVSPTNNPDRNQAIKGGYTYAMKRMLQQLLNIGDE